MFTITLPYAKFSAKQQNGTVIVYSIKDKFIPAAGNMPFCFISAGKLKSADKTKVRGCPLT